ncbi:MAG: serine hydrolase, partial [Bryobacteraceae bacterium]
ITAATAGFGGSVFIFAKNLDTGANYGLRPDDRVRTASTIKLPILCATFQAVAEGRLKWADLVTLHEADKISGSGVLGEFSDGVQLPLVDLAHLMIVVSDNTATNLVIDQVTADYVNQQMDKLGLKGTRSMRKVRGDGADLKAASGFSKAGLDPANQKYGIGSSTPREMVMLLERIEKGQIVSAEASKEMLKIMKRQRDNNGIARHMGDLVVANKSGALDHLRSDVGIVYAKGNRIAMAITCDDMPKIDWTSDNEGLLLISKIAEILVGELR